jgi:hypothetical protein
MHAARQLRYAMFILELITNELSATPLLSSCVNDSLSGGSIPKQLHFFRSSRRPPVLLLVIILVLFAAFVVSARTWLADDVLTMPVEPSSISGETKGTQPHEKAQEQTRTETPAEQLEVELITVGPNGFEPAQINRPPGPFILLIQNRSGTDLGPLRLEAEESGRPAPVSRIAEAQIDKERHDYGERLDLAPGRYRLRQSERSAWSFRIAIRESR